MPPAKKIGLACWTFAVALSLAACSATSDDASGLDLDATQTAPEGSITVFAAASLKGTFTALVDQFEAAHPDSTVVLNFAGSSDLVAQIIEGAPADVFASADEKNMATLTEATLIEEDAPVAFATNTLEIAVPPANPAEVQRLSDLAKPEVQTVICAVQVPCGAATATVETAAGIDIAAVSEELSVTDVLGKVISGEADAGLVYVTDVIAAGDAVEGIPFAESRNAVNVYPIAPVAASENTALAHAFIDFVIGSVGQRVLGAAGFGTP